MFMLFRCSKVSMASLIIWSMYVDFVERTVVSWSWMDVVLMHLDPGLDATAGLPDVDLTTLAGSQLSGLMKGRRCMNY
jgi:hypothetical protein